MKAEQLAIHSLSTSHRNLEEALHAYAAAGFRNVEPYLPLVKAWIEDGHTVEQTQGLFDSHGLQLIASSELAVVCFHASDVLLPNLRANVENARLISELGGSAMIVHTDGPEQATAASLDPIARALLDLAEATEDVGVDTAVEFNASPVVKSLQSAVRVAQIADHPRVGVLFDTAHYHVTPTKLADINEDSGKLIKHVHLNDMPDIPADLAHRDFDRVLPGEGVLDLPEIISALEENGYGRGDGGYALIGYDDLDSEQIEHLNELCETKLDEYKERRDKRIWQHRRMSAGYVSGTLRYEVLKRARFR